MSVKIIGQEVANMPWQDRPATDEGTLPLWRYNENPIIGRNPVKGVARIFNSAVVPYQGGFIGVFRGEQTNGVPYIYLGESKDAIHWDFKPDKIPFVNADGEEFMPRYAYDPRLVQIEDTYYIIWCQDFYGASIGVAKTRDFQTFTRLENPFIPFNRNAVLFPRKINGKFMMLSRPSDSGHTPFGDIFLSESPDMEYWGQETGGRMSRSEGEPPRSKLRKAGCFSIMVLRAPATALFTVLGEPFWMRIIRQR